MVSVLCLFRLMDVSSPTVKLWDVDQLKATFERR